MKKLIVYIFIPVIFGLSAAFFFINMEEESVIRSEKDIAKELVEEGGDKPSESELEGLSYRTIEWTDLMPQEDLDALLNPPEYLNEIDDGSMEDQIASQIQSQLDIDENDPYQKALVSTNVRAEMDGQLIRLPGFIVPLEFGASNFEITQFFFVPFFGACLHLPPPPPNQILFVEHPKGITLTALQDAFWVEGEVLTSLVENETATSAYSLELHSITPYYDPNRNVR